MSTGDSIFHRLFPFTAKTNIIPMDTHERHEMSFSHTYLCSARFIVNITQQNELHDNDKNLKLFIFMHVT